ncbi:MAG TPA: peptidylprolyl isomerase [Bacteroidetes bacterium]|nr:peptidylprolyl isomerase [Bacteroidota bacterium]
MKNIHLTFLFFGLLFFASCNKDDALSPTDQLKKDIQIIEEYLADNNLVADSTASGLRYIIDVEGTGNHPNLNDNVTIHYKGYYTDGEVFDQTTGSPRTFPLNNLIEGWKEGLQLFKKDGKGVLLIPSALGYGSRPPGGIRSNAVLIFDIEVVGF